MAGKKTARWRTILLCALWLGIVLGGIILTLLHREQYGVSTPAITSLGIFMLIIFITAFLPSRLQDLPLTKMTSRWATAFLILSAILFLALTLVMSFPQYGLAGSGVILLFMVVLTGALRDYIRDMRKKNNRDKALAANNKDHPSDGLQA
jgi:O-antigen/teichoic acid export membrane protein